jgi:hypothetical protein
MLPNKLECLFPDRPLQASLMLVSMPEGARVKHHSGVPVKGRFLALASFIRLELERLASDKHSSLFRTFIKYRSKICLTLDLVVLLPYFKILDSAWKTFQEENDLYF